MTADDSLLPLVGMLCAASGTALAGSDRSRRLGAAGLLLLGLALSAWWAGSPRDALPLPATRLGRGFQVGNGGLLLLGVVLVALAALRAPAGAVGIPARVLAAAGLVLLTPVVAGFAAAAGPLRALGAASALGLFGASVAIGMRALVGRAPVRQFSRRVARVPIVPALRGVPVVHRTILAAAVVSAGLAPHLAMLFVGVMVAAWAGYLGVHSGSQRPVPVAPVLTLLLLPAYWLIATVTGPVGLNMDALARIPMSSAAELLVAPALLLAAWAVTGLWPLQRQLPGALVAPAGALLLARAALPLVSEGLEYWRPLAVPLVWLGLWNAAAHRRWPPLVSGLGVLGLIAGGAESIAPAAGLLATGLVLEVAAGMPTRPLASAALRVPAWGAGTWCGLRVLEDALRGEVVYTTLGVLALALIVAASRASAHDQESPAR